MQGLQQALKSTSGKAAPPKPATAKVSNDSAKAGTKAKFSGRDGKEYTGAWLNPDFGTSLRLVQIRRRKDANGKKVYLDDLVAEALNDLFLKYDVPTVLHE
jgi:hypothetical protein